MIRLRPSSMQKLTPAWYCSRAFARAATLAVCLSLAACEAREPEPFFAKERPAPVERVRPAPTPAPAALPAPPPAAPTPPPMLRDPNSPDPLAGKFDLKAALAGLPGAGKKLTAAIETGMGTITCKLFADKTPNTVANFVGLARGLRPFWDPKQSAWVKRPLFDGTSFHRTIADFMIQGGDHMGDGTGQVGYTINDELVGLKHDRAGLLCMANRGANTNGGQFFITDAAAPHLTEMGTYTIFGECTPTELVHKIATSSGGMERPSAPVPIKKVTISR